MKKLLASLLLGLGLMASVPLALAQAPESPAAPSVLTQTPPARSMRPTACQTSAAPAAPA